MDELDRPNTWPATWALFTSTDRFARIFVEDRQRCYEHARAEVRDPAFQERVRSLDTVDEWTRQAHKSLAYVRDAFYRTQLIALAMLGVAVIAAFFVGAISPSLPWHWGKVLQAIGGFLALWGTLLALSGPQRSLDGESIPERVHGLTFTLLLSVGGALALLGMLISP